MLGSAALHIGCVGAAGHRVMRVGIVDFAPRSDWGDVVDELRARGWTEGTTIRFERRYYHGDRERLFQAVHELVSLNVDLIIAGGVPAAEAAKRATSRTPIVFAVGDAVGRGLVTDLARPEGNVTGVSGRFVETNAKRVELLKQVAPGVHRVAALLFTSNGYPAGLFRRLPSDVDLSIVEVAWPTHLDAILASIAAQRFEGVINANVFGTPDFNTRLLGLLDARRLPAVHPSRGFVDEGGLLSYATSGETLRQVGVYVDKILRGARPSDLPVGQPLTADLAINLRTARTLGLTIPRDLIVRADLIVE